MFFISFTLYFYSIMKLYFTPHYIQSFLYLIVLFIYAIILSYAKIALRVGGTDDHKIKHHLTNDDGYDGEDDESIPHEEAFDVISGDVLHGGAGPQRSFGDAVPQLLHSAALQTRLPVTLSHAWRGRHTGHTRRR